MKILVLNAGSSSLKYKLFVNQQETLAGMIASIHDYHQGILEVEAQLKEVGIHTLDTLDGVGHRVVHGGEAFRESVLIDNQVIETIRSLIPLAPLHNPANLEGIVTLRQQAPTLQQVAVFDTAFHQTLPPRAYRYALPHALYEEYGIRRYGFHGTSHAFVAKEAAKRLNTPQEQTNLITLHLGNGASVCAIQNGQSIDTSMGFTPLEGLIMGTRSGDIDPAILIYLARQLHYSVDEIDRLLNTQSGLWGIAHDNDMRHLHQRCHQGDKDAKLALDMFVYHVKKYIGSYVAILGRVDALVFTGGIGEHDHAIRKMITDNLPFDIPSLVIATNEELEIALETENILTH